ncbi:MAG: hypothetical protein IKI45_16495 [Oscillospiraceae bacterium]|nr:hypothetical protein [Oscillospiraceae bacterium]
MKRLLLLLITVSLLFTMIPHASAASQMTLSVLNASVLNAAGTEVCVPVLATPGFRYAAGIADIHWDAEVLSLKEVLFDEKAAPDNGSAPITDTGSYRISVGDYRAEKNYIGNGVFFTLIFAVKANAKSGNYAIQIQNAEFYNKDMERLYTETADGFVTISDGGLFSLAVESVSLEKDTKTFQTAVIAEQNPGYAAAIVDIIWNPEMFILQSVTFEESAAPDLATREIENNGCFRVSFGNYEAYQDYKQTGVLFTLQFQLAASAEPGEYIISLANADVVNSSLLPLDTVQSDGIVRIMGDKSDTITTATTSKATMTMTITTTTTSKATTTAATTTTTSKATTTTTAATTTTSKATTTTATTTTTSKATTTTAATTTTSKATTTTTAITTTTS